MALDQNALTTYMRERAAPAPTVVHAVLMGLVARIERGDFDEERNT